MPHMLKIKNLNVYYGHIHAIKGISLRVEEGEIDHIRTFESKKWFY